MERHEVEHILGFDLGFDGYPGIARGWRIADR